MGNVRRNPLLSAILSTITGIILLNTSCSSDAPPMSEALPNRDSLPVMVTHGVSKLISDSGIVRYKIVSEEWKVFDKTTPDRQEFLKGIVLERFDDKYRVNLYITADTAYCYHQNLWELRGRVFIKNMETQTTFRTEELFWDMSRHKLYSHRHMHIKDPSKNEELQGDSFESDEQLLHYQVNQSSGYLPMPHEEEEENNSSTNQDTPTP